MLANSTYCSPLEGLKCVNVVLNNCSDRASSSHIKFICTKRSGSDLPLFTKSHFHRLSAVSTTSPYLSASSKNHRFLTCVVVKRMPLHPALMKSFYTYGPRTDLCYPSSSFSMPFQAAKLFLDPDFVIQCFGCPSFRHLKL